MAKAIIDPKVDNSTRPAVLKCRQCGADMKVVMAPVEIHNPRRYPGFMRKHALGRAVTVWGCPVCGCESRRSVPVAPAIQ